MKLLSFLSDLGIIPNKGKPYQNDPALKQGQEFMDYNRLHKRREGENLQALQITSIPGVSSIVENMDNMKAAAGKNNSNNGIDKLELEFNKTLAEYDIVYKQFSESVLRQEQQDKEIRKYFDQIITSGDGNYSYVNDFGFTHKYSTDAWSSNAENCPTDPMTVSKELMAKFQTGEDMGVGQPCSIAGNNIQNASTKEYAWVDIKGKKHVYSGDLWKKKNENCSLPVISLSSDLYNAIPTGGNMTTTDNCMQLKVDPKIWNKLSMLNDKIETLAKEMVLKVDSLAIDDIKLNAQLQQQKNNLNNYISTISKDREQINFYNQNYNTVMGENEDAQLQQKSTRLHFIAWILLLITIFSLFMHSMMSSNSSISDNIIVILGLIFIFIVCKSIYSRFYYGM